MNSLRLPVVFALILLCSTAVQTQNSEAPQQATPKQDRNPKLVQRPSPTDLSAKQNATPQQIELTVPRGTPIRIALSRRVRIAHEGEPVEGTVTDTVYAFDQPVIPAGSRVRGHVEQVAPISKMNRAMAIADADFSPPHQYTVTFDTIILGDGRRLPMVTTASPGTANVVHLVSDPARAASRKNATSNPATQAAAGAKQQVNSQFHNAVTAIQSPGRMHRIKQFLLGQLPYRRQYLEPGTRFDADLESPLDFGPATRTPGQLRGVGAEPAPDTTLHARLADGVSSATASRGTPIEAVITQPVFNADHQLLLPANSHIFGEVTQARPAGKLHHNGELRVVFEKIATPEGQVQPMHGSLEGVEVARSASMKLDSEGGAHATDGKSRYISTGLAVVVAAAAAHPESDNGASDGLADPATRTAAGGSGFKLVGAVLGLASHSKVFSSTLGIYGAATSVYSHFLSRGKDVVLPKDTPIEIIFGQQGHAGSLPPK